MSWLATVLATFAASAVEVVETVTIVLAVGITRGWRSTLIGVGSAAVVLAVLAAGLGTALTKWVPLSDLKIAVGGLLLVFGLQWLRKAILRASGYKALHDEDQAFLEEREGARAARPRDIRLGTRRCQRGPAATARQIVARAPSRKGHGGRCQPAPPPEVPRSRAAPRAESARQVVPRGPAPPPGARLECLSPASSALL